MQAQDNPVIGISYLNALEYCPRRFYYEFVQGEMVVNEFVLEGTLYHEKADQPGHTTLAEGEQEIRHFHLYAESLGLSGFADIIHTNSSQTQIIPVEYKRGRKGQWVNDQVQLCAQALCLEAMLAITPLEYGYIFYWSSRRRVQVDFNENLRTKTRDLITLAHQIAREALPPPPLEGRMTNRCRDCSLAPLCLPEEVKLLNRQLA